jgi:hypothetical protein
MTKEDMAQITQRIERLEKVVFGKVGSKPKQEGDTNTLIKINFSLNERAFVKRYAAYKSGPKKFTLLLAYLAKGKIDENINLSDIRKHWSKMETKTLLGKFNLFYSNEAKTRGWVDVERHGIYKLTEEWEQVL